MKEIKVYNAIHQLKERGFKKDSVAKQLDINWRTAAQRQYSQGFPCSPGQNQGNAGNLCCGSGNSGGQFEIPCDHTEAVSGSLRTDGGEINAYTIGTSAKPSE